MANQNSSTWCLKNITLTFILTRYSKTCKTFCGLWVKISYFLHISTFIMVFDIVKWWHGSSTIFLAENIDYDTLIPELRETESCAWLHYIHHSSKPKIRCQIISHHGNVNWWNFCWGWRAWSSTIQVYHSDKYTSHLFPLLHVAIQFCCKKCGFLL